MACGTLENGSSVEKETHKSLFLPMVCKMTVYAHFLTIFIVLVIIFIVVISPVLYIVNFYTTMPV